MVVSLAEHAKEKRHQLQKKKQSWLQSIWESKYNHIYTIYTQTIDNPLISEIQTDTITSVKYLISHSRTTIALIYKLS